ncbi:Angiopoietin-related protein 3 Angiopoietin-like protein 3 ANGPTL3(17-224) Precursor [Channa argus]|uniref:Angiopoietin-related protein 3 Angiopoietin-like protein 3 ANGPTL3(17-224) n=1 Tax=Channa argus TaxID=215402 RepID=A0A6G1PK00_CHAAH|nr:Angiopoietin-related protein 3 Angiopoietin-like protein 3 ANGPTL3(17-224) Precursor [Channa argus]
MRRAGAVERCVKRLRLFHNPGMAKKIMMKLFWFLFLLPNSTAAVPMDSPGREEQPNLLSQAISTEPSPTEAKSPFAMLDDVRLLANGLLQLGQSLREFVHKTKAQINDIFQKLNIFDRSFYQLSVVTSEIKEEEEELKKTTNFLKANNEEIKNLSLEINSKINGILQERIQLQSKVGSLEERLKGLTESMVPGDQLSEITTLKEVIEAQDKTITNLLKAVKDQHDQLDYQKTKIKNLEEKLSYDSFQDTVNKATDSDPGAPHTLEYLTGNSTGLHTNDMPLDCSELFDKGEANSGIYVIKPNHSDPFNVYCDMGSDGGLTIIQRRVDGSVDFDETWEKYEKGFGDLEKDFWLGLKKIHSIAQQGLYILRVDLEDWREEKQWAEYSFSLEGPSKDYTLHVSHISSDSPDAMANCTGMRFSTKDRNDDINRNFNCTRNSTGGWWFNGCGETNLNGKYLWLKSKGRSVRRKGIHWKSGSGPSNFLKITKISMRPASAAESFN